MFTILGIAFQIIVSLLPWLIAVIRNTRFKWAILPACIMQAFVWEMNIALGLLFYISLIYFASTIPSRWRRKVVRT